MMPRKQRQEEIFAEVTVARELAGIAELLEPKTASEPTPNSPKNAFYLDDFTPESQEWISRWQDGRLTEPSGGIKKELILKTRHITPMYATLYRGTRRDWSNGQDGWFKHRNTRLSSWSREKDFAKNFGEYVFEAIVPSKMVLFNFGLADYVNGLDEGEMIIIPGNMKVRMTGKKKDK